MTVIMEEAHHGGKQNLQLGREYLTPNYRFSFKDWVLR